MEEQFEVNDKMITAFFTGYSHISHFYYYYKDDEIYYSGLDNFFTKLHNEIIEDIDQLNMWTIYANLVLADKVYDWIKKFHWSYDLSIKFNNYKDENSNDIPTPDEIICFFIGMVQWFPRNVKHSYQKQEEFLKCVAKEFCPDKEFEDVLDYWYFFETEKIVDELEEICIDKLGLRKLIVRPDNPNNTLYDTSETGLELHNFQVEMK